MCFSPVCSTIHLHTILLLKSHFEYQVCCCHSLKMILTPLAEKVDTFCKVVSARSKEVTVCGSKPSVYMQKFTKKIKKLWAEKFKFPNPDILTAADWFVTQQEPYLCPQLDFRTPPGFDRTRNAEIGKKDIKFKHLEEAFTSEHWLVRIYKVKKLENREPLDHKPRNVGNKQKYTSKKVEQTLVCK